MKKIVKLISVIIAVIMVSAMLTSCTSDEMSFLSALEKFSTATSYQSTSELTTEITAELPDYVADASNWPNLKSVLNSLKNFKIVTNTSTSMDKDKLLSKLEMSVLSEDFMFNTTGYIKGDDKGLVETFKIPTTLRWMLPEENMNAEYFTIDMNEFSEYMNELTTGSLGGIQNGMVTPVPFSLTPKNLVGEAKKMGDAYYKFQSEYAKRMVLAPQIITKDGSKYTLKFTDQSLKLFAKAIADTYLQDADAREVVEQFVTEIVTFYEVLYPGLVTTELKQQIFGTIGGVSATASSYQENVDEFFKIVEKLPILGEKGIEIIYTIDNRGFISKVDGYFDLLLDVNVINEISYGYADEDAEHFRFNLLLKFSEEYKNINQIVKVDFPKLTKENNVSYVDLMKKITENMHSGYAEYEPYRMPELELPAVDGSISVVHYNEVLDFGDTKPEIIGGTLYVPLDKMSQNFYFEYFWDYEKDCATINRDGTYLDVYLGDSILYSPDYSIILSNDTIDHNGQVYVPFRSFMKAFFGYYNINWDVERNAAIVGYFYYD